MSQYIITTHNPEKSEALIQYLRTLDFIEVEPVSPEDRRETALAFQKFLEALPERPSPQSSVNKAIKGYRKERGYQ